MVGCTRAAGVTVIMCCVRSSATVASAAGWPPGSAIPATASGSTTSGRIIWKACDGETPLTEMGRRLRDAFGERVEPAGERLARFVRMMLRSRMIEA